MAAHDMILKDEDSAESKNLSLEYQVLAKQTAMIGVVKQKVKATGELKEYSIDFNCKQVQQPVPQH